MYKGNKRFKMFKKLHYNIKGKLKIWNRESFQNIFKGKLELELSLKYLNERILLQGMREEDCLGKKKLNKDYEEILSREEV